MPFGNDVGAFASGFLGGMESMAKLRSTDAQTAFYNAHAANLDAQTKKTTAGLGFGAEAAKAADQANAQRAAPAAVPVSAYDPITGAPRQGYAQGGAVRRAYAVGGVVQQEPVVAQDDPAQTTAVPVQSSDQPAPQSALPTAQSDQPASQQVQASAPASVQAVPADNLQSNPAPPANPTDTSRNPILGAIDYMKGIFGLGGDATAVPSSDPQKQAGLTAFMRGAGAETNTGVAQAQQQLDREVPRVTDMTPDERNTFLLHYIAGKYYGAGMIEEGDRATASLIQNFRQNMGMYGALAIVAADNGDFPAAARNLEKAYAFVPDGNSMKVTTTGSSLSIQQLQNGKPLGAPTVLQGARAVQDAVGYALNPDNYMQHLLNEKNINSEIVTRAAQTAETARHDVASEGLEGQRNAIAASGVAEQAKYRQFQQDQAAATTNTFQSTQMARIGVNKAQRAFDTLPDDATQDQRDAAKANLDAANDAYDTARAGQTPGAANIDSQIDTRDSQIEEKRRGNDIRQQMADTRQQLADLTTQRAAENDPKKQALMDAQIGLLKQRAAKLGGSGPRAAQNPADFKVLGPAFDAAVDEWKTQTGSDLDPGAKKEARAAASDLYSVNPATSPEEIANAALGIRSGDFQVDTDKDGQPGLRVDGKLYYVTHDLAGRAAAWMRQRLALNAGKQFHGSVSVPTLRQQNPGYSFKYPGQQQ